jgi:thioredoxin 1
MAKADYIQDETQFDTLLAEGALFVVDCTATWCGPCKIISPLIDQLAEEYDNRVKVFKLDLDQNRAVADRFAIKSIPAVMLFKQGELVTTLVGVKPYEAFNDAVKQFL